MGRADGLRRRSEELQLDSNARHQGEQDASGDQSHGGLDGRLFREAETRKQRAKIADGRHSELRWASDADRRPRNRAPVKFLLPGDHLSTSFIEEPSN